ncbi:hypothetical protein H0X48_04630 [Candidatus Dependentiae bacterium]|nr:hypothetical protein [Candidatus Dependentiae bacterium]
MKLFSSLLALSFLVVPLAYGMNTTKPLLHDIDQIFLKYVTDIEAACNGTMNGTMAGIGFCVRDFISNNQNAIDAQDHGGFTRLHYAVFLRNIEIIRLLLDAGANANIESTMRQTPLLFFYTCLVKGSHVTSTRAHIKSNREIVNLLLSHTTSLNKQDAEGGTLLSYALKTSYDNDVQGDIFYSVLKAMHEENAKKDPLLLHETRTNCEQEIEQLLFAGAAAIPVNLLDDPLLMKAQQRQGSLLQAIQDNDSNTIAALLKQGAYQNQTVTNFLQQQLFQIVEQDDVEALRDYILNGFTLFVLDRAGNNIVHRAVQSKSIQVICYLSALLHKVGKLNNFLLKKNKAGVAPIDLAIIDQDIVKLFLGIAKDLPASKSWCTIS